MALFASIFFDPSTRKSITRQRGKKRRKRSLHKRLEELLPFVKRRCFYRPFHNDRRWASGIISFIFIHANQSNLRSGKWSWFVSRTVHDWCRSCTDLRISFGIRRGKWTTMVDVDYFYCAISLMASTKLLLESIFKYQFICFDTGSGNTKSTFKMLV